MEKALQSNSVHGGRSVIPGVHILAARKRDFDRPQSLGVNFKGPFF